jgi:hypothetical protein
VGKHRTASSYKNAKIHTREGEMAVTKDAAVCPAIRGGHAEPMGRCGEGWNRSGGDGAGIWVSVNIGIDRRWDSDSPGVSKAFWMV